MQVDLGKQEVRGAAVSNGQRFWEVASSHHCDVRSPELSRQNLSDDLVVLER